MRAIKTPKKPSFVSRELFAISSCFNGQLVCRGDVIDVRLYIQLGKAALEKHSEQPTNADQKSLETVFSIAICRATNGNRKLCF